MDSFFNNLRKFLTLSLVVMFAFVFTYIPQHFDDHSNVPTVHAAIPVTDVGNTLTNTWRNLKENVFDRIGWILAKAVISNIMASTIDWVNSGFRGSPAFIQDLDRFLLNTLDEEAGRILEEFGGPLSFICSPFRLDIQVALAIQYQQAREDRPYQGCRLTEAFENFDRFIEGDFMRGGWQDWFQITANPTQYTQYGSLLSAERTFETRLLDRREREIKELDFGNGFLSQKKCDPVTGPDGETREECKIVTPGQTISSRINTVLGLGEQSLIEADEINELIGALVGQIAVQAISGTAGLLGLSSNINSNSRFGFDGSYTDALRNEAIEFQRNSANEDLDRLRDSLEVQYDYEEMADAYNRQALSIMGRSGTSVSLRNAAQEVAIETNRNARQAEVNANDLEGKIRTYERLEEEYERNGTTNERKEAISAEQRSIILAVLNGSYYTALEKDRDEVRWFDALNPDDE